MGSDETEKGSSASDATFFNTYDNFSVGSTDGQLADFWKGQYKNINYANQVLDNIPAIEMTAALKEQISRGSKIRPCLFLFQTGSRLW